MQFSAIPVVDGADTPAETSTDYFLFLFLEVAENLQTISYSGFYFTDFLPGPS